MPTQSVNPLTGRSFGPVFADTDGREVLDAVSLAASASAAWGAMSPAQRAHCLDAVADALDAEASQLAQLAEDETALGIARLTGEVARTTFQLRMFASFLRDGNPDDVMHDAAVAGDPPLGHPDLRRMVIPVGPVAVFGASNFPFAFSVLGGDTASALAAGCPVVAKAHPSHPQTSARVAEIARTALAKAGAPAGVLGLVHGFEAGVALVQHPLIKAAAFTGSTAAGRALFDLAVTRPHPIPFYGELGSVNPVIVSPGAASRESLATEYLGSLCLGNGQFCTNPGLLLVPAGSGLVERITVALADMRPGPLLNANVEAQLRSHVAELASTPGVRMVAAQPDTAGPGFSASPAVLIADGTTALAYPGLMTTECFGPVGIIVEYESPTQLLSMLARLEGVLVAALHADEDEAMVPGVVDALTGVAGRLVWNGWPTGVAVTWAQHHGGPSPSTTNALHTSVGVTAMRRFQRPVAFQSFPERLLPEALR